MSNIKQELIGMLNRALELEHAARIQYLAHAEMVKGIYSEPIIARLKELASDEAEHEEKFRKLIGAYLGGEPSMKLATEATHSAKEIKDILEINFKIEKDTADFYEAIYKKIIEHKHELPHIFITLEHEMRHIILDEEEHIVELEALLS